MRLFDTCESEFKCAFVLMTDMSLLIMILIKFIYMAGLINCLDFRAMISKRCT